MNKRDRMQSYRCSECKTEWECDGWRRRFPVFYGGHAETCPECERWGSKLKRR